MTFTDKGYRDTVNTRFAQLIAELKAESGISFDDHVETLAKSPAAAASYLHMRDLVRAHFETIIECFLSMETRLSALEACGIKYMGVWQRASAYQKGMVVTHRGSAWIALGGVEGARPGESDNWQLMVKSGSDASERGRL